MPVYDYRCLECGDFEFTQSIKEDSLKECPTCGQKITRLISSNVGIIFKGSGFYINDSKKESPSSDKAS